MNTVNPSPVPFIVALLAVAALVAAMAFHVMPLNGLPDPSSPGGLLLAIIIVIPIVFVSAVVYLLPVIVVARRAHPQLPAIFVLDTFLGWTLLGWVVALAWANTNPQTVVVAPPVPARDEAEAKVPSSVLPDIAQLERLRDSGVIDHEEYTVAARKLLGLSNRIR